MVDLSVTQTSSTFCKSCFNSEIAWPPGFRSKKPWSFTGFPVITTALAPALVVGCPVKARWLPGRQLEEIPFESLAEEWQQNLPQPLVGNEGMKFYMVIMGIHSLHSLLRAAQKMLTTSTSVQSFVFLTIPRGTILGVPSLACFC